MEDARSCPDQCIPAEAIANIERDPVGGWAGPPRFGCYAAPCPMPASSGQCADEAGCRRVWLAGFHHYGWLAFCRHVAREHHGWLRAFDWDGHERPHAVQSGPVEVGAV